MEKSAPNGSQNRMPRWTRSEILVLIKSKRYVETPGACYLSTRGRPIASSDGHVATPKWLAVSAACAEKSVHRGPTQCRKRWGNLSAAFRKIKEYERKRSKSDDVADPVHADRAYWEMAADERKNKGLPGRFDRVVYEAMEGKEVDDVVDPVHEDEDDMAMDSEEEEINGTGDVAGPGSGPALSPIPISVRMFEPFQEGNSDPDMESDKQQDNISDKSPPQKEGPKRKRSQSFNTEDKKINLTKKLMETLERGSRLIAAQLDAHNIQAQLDRDLRREEFDAILKAFNRIADSVEKIARKF